MPSNIGELIAYDVHVYAVLSRTTTGDEDRCLWRSGGTSIPRSACVLLQSKQIDTHPEISCSSFLNEESKPRNSRRS